jgi:hypothetical protein
MSAHSTAPQLLASIGIVKRKPFAPERTGRGLLFAHRLRQPDSLEPFYDQTWRPDDPVLVAD